MQTWGFLFELSATDSSALAPSITFHPRFYAASIAEEASKHMVRLASKLSMIQSSPVAAVIQQYHSRSSSGMWFGASLWGSD